MIQRYQVEWMSSVYGIYKKEDGEWCKSSEVAALEAENERLKNSRDYYKECWDMACTHVAEACKSLGVDPEDTAADTWTLCEAASRSASELETLRQTLATYEREAAHAVERIGEPE